ncbi:MAG: hypothetical protein VYC39_07435 [Myxococcota bacterium]|nr:hypothetical protein [Myxococcota bacterium]
MSHRLGNNARLSPNWQNSGLASRASASSPGGKPPARLPTPPQSESATSKGLSTNLIRKIGGLNRLFPKLNVQQKKAFRELHQLLEPSKFGGRDKTLNYGDVQAVTKSLVSDQAGLQRLAVKRLESKGKNVQSKLVKSAFSDESAMFASAIRGKVTRNASRVIEDRLKKILNAENVDSSTAAYFDDAPRNLTFRDAARFQRAHKIFRDLRRQTEQSLGVRLVFPKGLSQDFMKHIAEGRAGFPPDVSFREL